MDYFDALRYPECVERFRTQDYRRWFSVTTLDQVFHEALKQGRSVELTLAEDYGFHIGIDGVAITETSRSSQDEGLPWEALEASIDGERPMLHPAEDAQKKIDEVMDGDSDG